jgi:serine acetyltransferase
VRRTDVINRLLFEFDLLSEDEISRLISDLPRKIVRWLAINHSDNRIRKIFYKATGVQIGEGTVINPGVIIEDCCRSLVKIGERVSIAAGVMLIADAAPDNSRLAQVPCVRDHLIVEKEVIVEDDAWIGAAAVVTHSVSPATTVAGVRTKEVRKIAALDPRNVS